MSEVIFTHALTDDLEAYCLRQALPKKLVLCVDKYIDTHFGVALNLELRKKKFYGAQKCHTSKRAQ
jgi:hypothetical protein